MQPKGSSILSLQQVAAAGLSSAHDLRGRARGCDSERGAGPGFDSAHLVTRPQWPYCERKDFKFIVNELLFGPVSLSGLPVSRRSGEQPATITADNQELSDLDRFWAE